MNGHFTRIEFRVYKERIMAQSDNFFGDPLTYEQVQELLPGFAIGALDVHEMQAVERYLQQHEQLIQTRYDLELASQAIAYSAAPQPLPSSIKHNLMERVRAEAAVSTATVQPRRTPFAATQPAPAPMPAPPSRSAKRSGALPLFPEQTRRQSGWASWAQGLIGVAAVAATAVLLFSNWQLQRQSETLIQQVASTQQELAQREQSITSIAEERTAAVAQLTEIQSTLQRTEQDIAELSDLNSTLQQTVTQQTQQIDTLTKANRLLTLAGLGTAQQANGTFFVSDGTVVLSLRGLPPVAEDKTYQLWYLPEGGSPEPANVFQVESGDSTILTFTLPSDVTTFANVGVSIEPAGGSEAPTDIVLLSTT